MNGVRLLDFVSVFTLLNFFFFFLTQLAARHYGRTEQKTEHYNIIQDEDITWGLVCAGTLTHDYIRLTDRSCPARRQ